MSAVSQSLLIVLSIFMLAASCSGEAPPATTSPTPGPAIRIEEAIEAFGSYLGAGISRDDARANLVELTSRWTQGWRTTSHDATVDYYLTYVSPHVLAAAVVDASLAQNLTSAEAEQMLADAMTRFFERGELPFIMFVRSNDPERKVDLGQLGETICLKTLDGTEVYPSRYDTIFDTDFAPGPQGKKGFIFIPSMVNFREDPSFTVHLGYCAKADDGEVDHRLAWNFALVSLEFPIQDVVALLPPLPSEAPSDSGLVSPSVRDFLDIATMISSFVTLFIR